MGMRKEEEWEMGEQGVRCRVQRECERRRIIQWQIGKQSWYASVKLGRGRGMSSRSGRRKRAGFGKVVGKKKRG